MKLFWSGPKETILFYNNKKGIPYKGYNELYPAPSDVGEPREDKDNGHIPSAVTGCLQFGEDATSMTRRLSAEAPKKKLFIKKNNELYPLIYILYINPISNL
jgi:hypothetical protein